MRRGGTLWIVIVLILIVGLAAVSVASTIYAMRTVEERDRVKEDFARSSNTVDEMVIAVANSGKLKGATAAEARQEILQPAVDHYKRIIEKYRDDEQMLPTVASAQLCQAALQAKLGLPECIRSLSGGLASLNQMLKSDFGEESYPSFQDSVLRIAAPADWITVKDSTPAAQGVALYTSLEAGASVYRKLSAQFPQSITFRDDLAELLKSLGTLLGFINRGDAALDRWAESRDVLETLVRDEPDNADFQERLADSLVNTARLENSSGETDKAIADYKRALEVRQKMAEANPEDESLEKASARVQRDLERVETAAASKKETPKDETAADEAPKTEASEKQPAKDDAPKEEAPKDEAPKDEAPQE